VFAIGINWDFKMNEVHVKQTIYIIKKPTQSAHQLAKLNKTKNQLTG